MSKYVVLACESRSTRNRRGKSVEDPTRAVGSLTVWGLFCPIPSSASNKTDSIASYRVHGALQLDRRSQVYTSDRKKKIKSQRLYSTLTTSTATTIRRAGQRKQISLGGKICQRPQLLHKVRACELLRFCRVYIRKSIAERNKMLI